MEKFRLVIVLTYFIVIVGIFVAPFSNGLAIVLYAVAVIVGIVLLTFFQEQPMYKYLIYPLILYPSVEAVDIIVLPQFINNYYFNILSLLFTVIVTYLAYVRKQR